MPLPRWPAGFATSWSEVTPPPRPELESGPMDQSLGDAARSDPAAEALAEHLVDVVDDDEGLGIDRLDHLHQGAHPELLAELANPPEIERDVEEPHRQADGGGN